MRRILSVIALALASSVGVAQAGHKGVGDAIAALAASLPVTLAAEERQADWTWVELEVGGGAHPLTVDLVGRTDGKHRKVVFCLPVSGMSFRANFFAQPESLAQFLRAHDYLVVGVTPREDRLTAETDLSITATWGVAAHREDLRRVVEAITAELPLHYDLLAYSFSAATAIDYAATYSDKLDRLIVLDFYSLDPSDAAATATAQRLHDAYVALLEAGVYADTSLASLEGLILGAMLYPDADSGVARDFIGLPGNFTLDGLLHFWLVYTGMLPGVHTPITGLPNDWPLVLSTLAGWYAPALDPLEDTFGFTHTDKSVLAAAAMAMGSGHIPLAFMRDVTAIGAGLASYPVDYGAIDEEVLWVNNELGYGAMTWAADAIRDAGNPHVSVVVLPGYGNIDSLYGRDAATAVWPLLLD